MTNVVFIGYYNKNGQFESNMWRFILKLLRLKCDNIKIYTQLECSEVSNYFGNSGKVIQQESPDKSLNYKSYKIICQNEDYWLKIQKANFHIDHGITHLYFFHGNNFVGELETEDCENFVFLEIWQDEELGLLTVTPEFLENVNNCYNMKEEIDYRVNYEEWKPLGVLSNALAGT
ncbi:MAG: hypothetical protein FWG40_12560 [Peptococcaceae bacterium]|nr:hypothetical protein [Peptococcaceae bacterium]